LSTCILRIANARLGVHIWFCSGNQLNSALQGGFPVLCFREFRSEMFVCFPTPLRLEQQWQVLPVVECLGRCGYPCRTVSGQGVPRPERSCVDTQPRQSMVMHSLRVGTVRTGTGTGGRVGWWPTFGFILSKVYSHLQSSTVYYGVRGALQRGRTASGSVHGHGVCV
jgi:hypothetical protein